MRKVASEKKKLEHDATLKNKRYQEVQARSEVEKRNLNDQIKALVDTTNGKYQTMAFKFLVLFEVITQR